MQLACALSLGFMAVCLLSALRRYEPNKRIEWLRAGDVRYRVCKHCAERVLVSANYRLPFRSLSYFS